LKIRLEATEDELVSKSLSLVRHVASSLAKYDPRLAIVAKALWKSDMAAVGKTDYQGLSIEIENPVGSTRSWTDVAGRSGTTVMQHAYGRVARTKGADGDGYDCFLGPDPDAPFVWIIDQKVPETGAFDEQKAMLGFDNAHAATAAYHAHYDDPRFFGSLMQMGIDEFKEKVLSTCSPAEDGVLKSVSRTVRSLVSARPVLTVGVLEKADTNLAPIFRDVPGLGDRAVMTGGSGPNIAFKVPPRPKVQTSTSTNPTDQLVSLRAAMEALVSDRDELREQAPHRKPADYATGTTVDVVPRPLPDQPDRVKAGEDARAEGPDMRASIQSRLDARLDLAGETGSNKLIPRDAGVATRLFLPASARLKRGGDNGMPDGPALTDEPLAPTTVTAPPEPKKRPPPVPELVPEPEGVPEPGKSSMSKAARRAVRARERKKARRR